MGNGKFNRNKRILWEFFFSNKISVTHFFTRSKNFISHWGLELRHAIFSVNSIKNWFRFSGMTKASWNRSSKNATQRLKFDPLQSSTSICQRYFFFSKNLCRKGNRNHNDVCVFHGFLYKCKLFESKYFASQQGDVSAKVDIWKILKIFANCWPAFLKLIADKCGLMTRM